MPRVVPSPLRSCWRRPAASDHAALLACLPRLASAPASAERAGRTWVVDAVDDHGDTELNRWDSVDTGTTVVTIRVGDTVEWQFDRATQGHDLISLPPSGARGRPRGRAPRGRTATRRCAG